MVKSANRWEFGDFQTPFILAQDAVAHLVKFEPEFQPKTIIEPTCGIGAFLFAAADAYPEAERVVGLEIEPGYLNAIRSRLVTREDAGRFELRDVDFFKMDWENFLIDLPEPVLVIGNPPWVTSADIGRLNGSNLPEKSNFQKYTGFEAVTGKANFDISESMMTRNLEWISEHSGCLAMLCKTAVARKLLRHAWKNDVMITGSRIVTIDAMRHFSAAVDACFFSLRTGNRIISTSCACFDGFDSSTPSNIIGFHEGTMLSHVDVFHKHKEFFGKDCCYTWRSGVKHDNSKVMELRKTENGLENGYGDRVEIEDLCVFPLLKSSDLGNRHVNEARLDVIVTQRKIGQETDYIYHDAPLTWQYLNDHASTLDGRKSSIYHNMPRFSVFGVGDYTFANWKVAISGFYKRLEFQIVAPINGKPVVFDDTVYFLSATTEAEAIFLAELLNSTSCQEFLESMVFWTNKRPITIELLKRVDLEKVAINLNRGDEYKQFTKKNVSLAC